jgi:hypothetical protein
MYFKCRVTPPNECLIAVTTVSNANSRNSDIGIAFFTFELHDNNLTGRTSNDEHLGHDTEADLLYGETRVVCKWIVVTDLKRKKTVKYHYYNTKSIKVYPTKSPTVKKKKKYKPTTRFDIAQ